MDRTESMSQAPERDPIERIAEEFLERHRRGECPEVTEYTKRYPAHAEEIRELFPVLLIVENLGEQEHDQRKTAGSGRRQESRT